MSRATNDPALSDLRWAARLREVPLAEVARRVGAPYMRTWRVLHDQRLPLPGELDAIRRALGLPAVAREPLPARRSRPNPDRQEDRYECPLEV